MSVSATQNTQSIPAMDKQSCPVSYIVGTVEEDREGFTLVDDFRNRTRVAGNSPEIAEKLHEAAQNGFRTIIHGRLQGLVTDNGQWFTGYIANKIEFSRGTPQPNTRKAVMQRAKD
ncbi:MAG: hypothetical protein R3C68_14175 [Myxococcota bacterium]